MHTHRSSEATVLLVDDDPALSAALSCFLNENGMKTIAAHTGAGGLQQLSQHSPAAAVIDIHLPDMSGLQLAQQLRARAGSAFPIIVLSGDSSMTVLNSLAEIGATYFFNKPVNRHLLVQRLRELLQKQHA